MIIIDTNLLIYAVNRDSPLHEASSTWLNEQLSAGVPTGLPWLVVVGFLRLITNPRVMPLPLKSEPALSCMNSWLALPNVTPIEPGPNHWATLARLLVKSGTAGNLTNDAHLAAIAIDQGALLCSADNDFRRFEGVQFFNPLADDNIREPMLSYSR